MKKLAMLFALILMGFGLSGCSDGKKPQETSPIPKATLNVDYRKNEIVKISLKEGTTNLILFESENIQNFILSNGEAFEANTFANPAHANKANTLVLKPKAGFIGADSDLMIYTESGKNFYFYISSVDFKSSNNPPLFVMVKSEKYDSEKNFVKMERNENGDIGTSR